MKVALILIAVLALTGCAELAQNGRYNKDSADYRDCEYKAKVATPGSANALDDAFRQIELTNMCMRNKGH